MSAMSLLPTEILMRIFEMFPNHGLSNVVAACRRWRKIGENPRLWSWGRVRVGRADTEMLGIRRLGNVQEITVVGGDWKMEELEKLLQAVTRLHKLTLALRLKAAYFIIVICKDDLISLERENSTLSSAKSTKDFQN